MYQKTPCWEQHKGWENRIEEKETPWYQWWWAQGEKRSLWLLAFGLLPPWGRWYFTRIQPSRLLPLCSECGICSCRLTQNRYLWFKILINLFTKLSSLGHGCMHLENGEHPPNFPLNFLWASGDSSHSPSLSLRWEFLKIMRCLTVLALLQRILTQGLALGPWSLQNSPVSS